MFKQISYIIFPKPFFKSCNESYSRSIFVSKSNIFWLKLCELIKCLDKISDSNSENKNEI